jgi:hypothetical protein
VKFDIIGGPDFLKGSDLEQALIKMEYIHTVRERPKFIFEFNNTSGKIFNFGVLLAGLNLKVRFGYQHVMSRPFKVPVVRIAAASVGQPGVNPRSPRPGVYGTVKFEAKVHNWKLSDKPDKDIFVGYGVKLSTAVRQIARAQGYRENQIFIQEGLALNNQPEPILDQVHIHGMESAEQFLKDHAKFRGFNYSATRKAFHFHADDWKPQLCEAISYFKGPDLISYTIDGDFRMAVSQVTAKGVDPKSAKPVTYTFNQATNNVEGVIASSSGKRGDTNPESIAPNDIIVAISRRAIEKAARRLVNHIKNKWKIELTLVGNPSIFVGKALALDNFGPLLDGQWFVKEVRHVIDTTNGYRTIAKVQSKKASKASAGMVVPIFVFDPETNDVVGVIAAHKGEPPRLKGTKKGRKKRAKKNLSLWSRSRRRK